MNYKKELEERLTIINRDIRDWLPDPDLVTGKLPESMHYSLTSGGKYVRPLLMYEACRLYSGNVHEIKPFLTAMECLHTASLVHDDLPAIDNDSIRRGRPSTHAAYGEAMGILCGDALMNYAFELLIAGIGRAENTRDAIRAARYIARKAGYEGMLGGQSLDVTNEKLMRSDLSKEELDDIYERKTASLIEASLVGGAAFAGAEKEDLDNLEKAGSLIGRAFQIKDDILDVTASTETLGKPASSDIKNGKTTYVTLMGVDRAEAEVKNLTLQASEMLDRLPEGREFLKEFLLRLVNREK